MFCISYLIISIFDNIKWHKHWKLLAHQAKRLNAVATKILVARRRDTGKLLAYDWWAGATSHWVYIFWKILINQKNNCSSMKNNSFLRFLLLIWIFWPAHWAGTCGGQNRAITQWISHIGKKYSFTPFKRSFFGWNLTQKCPKYIYVNFISSLT